MLGSTHIPVSCGKASPFALAQMCCGNLVRRLSLIRTCEGGGRSTMKWLWVGWPRRTEFGHCSSFYQISLSRHNSFHTSLPTSHISFSGHGRVCHCFQGSAKRLQQFEHHSTESTADRATIQKHCQHRCHTSGDLQQLMHSVRNLKIASSAGACVGTT